MRRRFLTGGAAAMFATLLLAGSALAGGWATIAPDEGSAGDQPKAGETDELGFTVLQHGVTPAGFVKATVVLENSSTGETLRVEAQPSGPTGHFVAPLRFPEAGFWTWRVELDQLEMSSPPTMVTVLTASGGMPAFDASAALKLVEQAKADLRAELQTAYSGRIEQLELKFSAANSRVGLLERERDALQARVDSLGAPATGVPILAILAVAILGGGIAGFAMASLGRRPVKVLEEPAPAPGYAPTR
jgi:hypothetical protein